MVLIELAAKVLKDRVDGRSLLITGVFSSHGG